MYKKKNHGTLYFLQGSQPGKLGGCQTKFSHESIFEMFHRNKIFYQNNLFQGNKQLFFPQCITVVLFKILFNGSITGIFVPYILIELSIHIDNIYTMYHILDIYQHLNWIKFKLQNKTILFLKLLKKLKKTNI